MDKKAHKSLNKKPRITTSSQLDILQKTLEKEKIPYERIDEYDPDKPYNRHQLYFPNKKENIWDAICHKGSYGYEQGLLEISGEIVPLTYGDTVIGNLTASDVFNFFINSQCYKDWLGDK